MPLDRIALRWMCAALASAGAACSDGSTAPKIDLTSGRLSVGEQTACALQTDGTMYCWGQSSIYFEYGMHPATQPTSGSPVRVPAPALVSLAPGVSQHMCGRAATSNDVICWGRGGTGQLGTGMTEATGNPYGKISGSSWNVIGVSRLTTCGVTTLGTGLCWGINQRGELGTTAVAIGSSSSLPMPVEVTANFKMIAPGWLHSCGITADDRAMCWGDNVHGQLGIGVIDSADTPADEHLVPAPVATTEKFLTLSSGALQTCGITLQNRVMCWGDNETGQLGDGTKTNRSVPTAIASDQKFAMVSVGSGFRGGATALPPTGVSVGGSAHTCALTTTGAAFCWGWNGDGQLGDGTTVDRMSPVAVSSGLSYSTIGAGGAFTCAMTGQQVQCWGANSTGQLGRGVIGLPSMFPVSVAAPFTAP
jgi:alpha-tubulin suppressor-like RCC1 family protein